MIILDKKTSRWLSIGVVSIVLLLLAVLVLRERQQQIVEVRDEISDSGNVDIRILSQGVNMAPAALSADYQLPPAAIIIDDYVFRSAGNRKGLHVATLGPDFVLADRRWFDLAESVKDGDAFCQYVSMQPINTTLLIGTYGDLQLKEGKTLVLRERLEKTFATLGAKALPFNHSGASWALVTLLRPEGWVNLTESHSQLSGVFAAFTIQPNLSIYDDYDGDFVDDKTPPHRKKVSYEDSDILRQICQSDDLFELATVKEKSSLRHDLSPALMVAYLKRRDELVALCERKTAIDGALDLVSFKVEKIEGERHVLRWYFVVTDDISEKWILDVRLKEEKSHLDILPEANRDKGYLRERIYAEKSQIRQWKAGEHRILSLHFNLKDIPYDISSLFYQWFSEKPSIYDAPISHGWYMGDQEKLAEPPQETTANHIPNLQQANGRDLSIESSQVHGENPNRTYIIAGHFYSLYNHERGHDLNYLGDSLVRLFVEEVKRSNCKAVFLLGDTICSHSVKESLNKPPYPTEWDFIFSIFGGIVSKTYFAPGNHDMSSRALYLDRIGYTRKVLVLGRDKFVILPCVNWFNDKDLRFIENAVRGEEEIDNVFIMMHYRLYSYRYEDYDKSIDIDAPYKHGISNWNRDVVPLIKGKVKYIFCGDLLSKTNPATDYTCYKDDKNGIYYLNTSFNFLGKGSPTYLKLRVAPGGEVSIVPCILPVDALSAWYDIDVYRASSSGKIKEPIMLSPLLGFE